MVHTKNAPAVAVTETEETPEQVALYNRMNNYRKTFDQLQEVLSVDTKSSTALRNEQTKALRRAFGLNPQSRIGDLFISEWFGTAIEYTMKYSDGSDTKGFTEFMQKMTQFSHDIVKLSPTKKLELRELMDQGLQQLNNLNAFMKKADGDAMKYQSDLNLFREKFFTKVFAFAAENQKID